MPASTEAQITEWIATQQQPMIDLLRDVVNIDSGSYDKPGVDAVGARFEQHFAAHGIEAWREPHDVFGDAVHALVAKPGSNEKPVLLMGHRDTVFPKGDHRAHRNRDNMLDNFEKAEALSFLWSACRGSSPRAAF